jgi:uncharacterized membrane protein SirB2
MLYLALKNVHIACVIVSGLGFFMRGLAVMLESPLIDRRWVKTFPHIVDTVLLSSAIGMAVISSQYPITHSWLTAKLVALLVYIWCGVMALRKGRGKTTRGVFFVGALAVYSYIISVALRHNPLGFFELISPVFS